MINLFRLRSVTSPVWKAVLLIIMVFLFGAGTKVFFMYRDIYGISVDLKGEKRSYFYIGTGETMEDVLQNFEKSGKIRRLKGLAWVMDQKNYANHVNPGCYELTHGMDNNVLVNMLRSGMQSPVNLTFNNCRTLEDFTGKIARQIELDSASLLSALKDEEVVKPYGFSVNTIAVMFIPNTYQVFWDITADEFIKRMHKEYLAFWSVDRLKKAEEIGLSPVQVSILASIVDEETIKEDEKSMVAGVYINRLKRRIRLQACPTLKFALGDFSIRRLQNKDKQIDSPYNTYKYYGLPPGPIRQPSISGIDAVLNYQKHRYLYFCARADFSGYHVFAKTLAEHNRNARKYHRALNDERIFR